MFTKLEALELKNTNLINIVTVGNSLQKFVSLLFIGTTITIKLVKFYILK